MILPAVPALAAAAYYLLAIAAALRWKTRATRTAGGLPISLLKPMYGTSPELYAALRSHALQDYPELEILFGVSNPQDAALADIARLQREFPSIPMRVIAVATDAPNPKAFVLAQLARHASHPLLVVNDDDMVVEPGYFQAVTAPLADPEVGLVTCLYRARAGSWPAALEALGVTAEFTPGVLVARLLGMGDFALGATMALRAGTLREIGGFEPLAYYLADDYQLGRRIAAKGYRVEFAPMAVETALGATSWTETWRHQLRWARTVRISRPAGYYSSALMQATVWAVVSWAAREWWAGALALGARLLAAWIVARRIVKDRETQRRLWLVPLRDFFGFAVWLGGCFGGTVDWRGRKLRLARDGRISLE